jgi:Zn-dependent protease
MNIDTVIYIGIVIYSIVLHEIAHGWTAYVFGDNTAKEANRLTLNPVPHIDPIGSVLVPVSAVLMGFGVFGWAKGVPINMHNIGASRVKEFLVSAAGIITNILIAIIFLLLIKYNIFNQVYEALMFKVVVVNIGLAFFNLLPIPPFDGMSILRSIFPRLKHKFQYIEHNPASMIVAILAGSYLFSFIYRDIVNFFVNLFL